MRSLPAALLGALAAAGAVAVVSHGTGQAKVVRPARLNNRTIGRAARRARAAAVPKAVKAARREAALLARAAGLRLSDAIGIARDVSPYGFDYDAGRFGEGDWCGRWVRRCSDARAWPG